MVLPGLALQVLWQSQSISDRPLRGDTTTQITMQTSLLAAIIVKEGSTGYLGNSAFVTQGGILIGKGPGAGRQIQRCLEGVILTER